MRRHCCQCHLVIGSDPPQRNGIRTYCQHQVHIICFHYVVDAHQQNTRPENNHIIDTHVAHPISPISANLINSGLIND